MACCLGADKTIMNFSRDLELAKEWTKVVIVISMVEALAQPGIFTMGIIAPENYDFRKVSKIFHFQQFEVYDRPI